MSGFGAAVLEAWGRVHVADGPFRVLWTEWKWAAVAGKLGLVAQYNKEHWAKKRGGRHVPEHSPVSKPFNPDGFNFNKIPAKEVLLRCNLTSDGKIDWTVGADAAGGDHMVAINVSPMFRGHSLLVVAPERCLPQAVCLEGARLAVAAASAVREGDPSLRIGYNSLGAFASVNHQHYHIIATAPTTPLSAFPVEAAPLSTVGEIGGVSLQTTDGWPCRTIALSSADDAALSRGFFLVCDQLREQDVPFNAVIRGRAPGEGGTATAWIFPRRNQSNNAGTYRAAVVELAGIVTVVEQEHLETSSEGAIAGEIVDDVTLDEHAFGDVVTACSSRLRS